MSQALLRGLRTALLIAGPGLLALPPSTAGAQDPDPSDRLDVIGVVTDGETGRPLGGVAVIIQAIRPGPAAGGVREALTGPDGAFAFRGLSDGRYRLRLERLGYGTLLETVAFRGALGLRIQAELVPDAVELEPVLVAVTARSRRLEHAGFYRRRDRGIGRFISRADIEARHPLRVTDLLAVVPGVRLVRSRGTTEPTVIRMRGNCIASVYLDGVRTVGPFPLDVALHPDEIAGIEVYHGSETPASYRTSACGTVMVWTEVPEPEEGSKPLTWRRVLAVVGFLAVALVLVGR